MIRASATWLGSGPGLGFDLSLAHLLLGECSLRFHPLFLGLFAAHLDRVRVRLRLGVRVRVRIMVSFSPLSRSTLYGMAGMHGGYAWRVCTAGARHA